MLYAARQRAACFAETLATFRPSLELLAETGDPADIVGAVSAGFLRSRGVAAFHLRAGRWLDIRQLETLAALRSAFGSTLHEFGLTDVDLSGVCGPQRMFTQSVAAWAYEHGYHGIVYASRLGATFECWAIFDNAAIEPARVATPLSLDDPDLLAVATVFALHLPTSLDQRATQPASRRTYTSVARPVRRGSCHPAHQRACSHACRHRLWRSRRYGPRKPPRTTCAHCGDVLVDTEGPTRRFCGERCRRAVSRLRRSTAAESPNATHGAPRAAAARLCATCSQPILDSRRRKYCHERCRRMGSQPQQPDCPDTKKTAKPIDQLLLPRICAACGQVLNGAAARKHCDGRCRTRAYRFRLEARRTPSMTTIITRVHLPGIGHVCPECFSRGHLTAFPLPPGEVYSFGVVNPPAQFDWNVDSARALIAARPRSAQRLESECLQDWLANRSTHAPEHLDHIPTDKLEEPGILVEVLAGPPDGELQPFRILIDGTHRAARKARHGQHFWAYLLTEGEQRSVCTYYRNGQPTELPSFPARAPTRLRPASFS